jgi:hypothetical protein
MAACLAAHAPPMMSDQHGGARYKIGHVNKGLASTQNYPIKIPRSAELEL